MKAYLASDGYYPPLMKKGIIEKFMWEAKFACECSNKPGAFEDINYIFGSVFHIVCSWLQVLYALNKTYLMNEKKALPHISRLSTIPDEFQLQINQVYSTIADGNFDEAYVIILKLDNEIRDLCAAN